MCYVAFFSLIFFVLSVLCILCKLGFCTFVLFGLFCSKYVPTMVLLHLHCQAVLFSSNARRKVSREEIICRARLISVIRTQKCAWLVQGVMAAYASQGTAWGCQLLRYAQCFLLLLNTNFSFCGRRAFKYSECYQASLHATHCSHRLQEQQRRLAHHAASPSSPSWPLCAESLQARAAQSTKPDSLHLVDDEIWQNGMLPQRDMRLNLVV